MAREGLERDVPREQGEQQRHEHAQREPRAPGQRAPLQDDAHGHGDREQQQREDDDVRLVRRARQEGRGAEQRGHRDAAAIASAAPAGSAAGASGERGQQGERERGQQE